MLVYVIYIYAENDILSKWNILFALFFSGKVTFVCNTFHVALKVKDV